MSEVQVKRKLIEVKKQLRLSFSFQFILYFTLLLLYHYSSSSNLKPTYINSKNKPIIPTSSHLILKALENQLSLFIFILPDSIFCFEFIVLHSLGVVEVDVFGVEHVRAEVEDCAFVDLGCLIL